LKRDKVRCKIEQERKLMNHEDLGSWNKSWKPMNKREC
jgi:hypothetical protein